MIKRLDNIIKEKEYDLQLLKLLKEVIESGDCNICKIKEKCEYAPEIGELVRYNCPLFVSKRKKKEKNE